MAKVVDKERKQAELIEVAVEVFSRHGYQSTSMEMIAEQAGVSKGLLYVYFKNKEALFSAVFRWFGDMTWEMMEKAAEDSDNEVEQLLAIVEVWIEIATDYAHYIPLFLDFWSAANVKGMRSAFGDNLAGIYIEQRRMVAEIIRRGERKGLIKPGIDADAVAYLLVGGMDGMYVQTWLAPPEEIEKTVRSALLTIIDAIRLK